MDPFSRCEKCGYSCTRNVNILNWVCPRYVCMYVGIEYALTKMLWNHSFYDKPAYNRCDNEFVWPIPNSPDPPPPALPHRPALTHCVTRTMCSCCAYCVHTRQHVFGQMGKMQRGDVRRPTVPMSWVILYVWSSMLMAMEQHSVAATATWFNNLCICITAGHGH